MSSERFSIPLSIWSYVFPLGLQISWLCIVHSTLPCAKTIATALQRVFYNRKVCVCTYLGEKGSCENAAAAPDNTSSPPLSPTAVAEFRSLSGDDMDHCLGGTCGGSPKITQSRNLVKDFTFWTASLTKANAVQTAYQAELWHSPERFITHRPLSYTGS